jgi:hypothetical protein
MTITSTKVYINNWTSDCAVHNSSTAQEFINNEDTVSINVELDANLPNAASWDNLGNLIHFTIHYSNKHLGWLERLAGRDDMINLGFMLEVRAVDEEGLEYVEYYQTDINDVNLLYSNPEYFTFQVTAARDIKGWDSSHLMFTGL